MLSNNKCFLKLFLLITAVTVVLAEPVQIISQVGQSGPFVLIERMKPAPAAALRVPCTPNRTGLYVMWQKLLVRVSSQWQQSVLSKSFGVMKVPSGAEMTPYSIEQTRYRSVAIEGQFRYRNVAIEVEMEKRVINAVLTLMKILLALDIVILLGVFIMLLSCCCKSRQRADEVTGPPEVVKA